MRQLITREYQFQFWHDERRGDMQNFVRNCVLKKRPVPVDITIIVHQNFPFPIEGRIAEVFSQKRIDILMENLNKQYGEPTNRRLQFARRSIRGHYQRDFPLEIMLDEIATDTEYVPDGFTLRILPFYQPFPEGTSPLFGRITMGPSGRYHARGLIDMHVETVLAPRTYPSLLAHEIGHGIFGYGHHSTRADHLNKGFCIMNADNYKERSTEFCAEHRKLLKRL